MGTKENFNQALHEVFPFYKNAKASDAGAELNTFVASKGSEAVKYKPLKKDEPLDFETYQTAKKQASIETTYISKDTKITGAISSSSNIDISGSVFGDVESQYTIRISGKVEGNVNGKNVEVNNATIKGDIHASERLSTSQSTIVGNISAEELEFNSKITGNIKVKKEIAIKKESCIEGDVSAMTISIEKGAAVKGMMTIRGERKEAGEENPE